MYLCNSLLKKMSLILPDIYTSNEIVKYLFRILSEQVYPKHLTVNGAVPTINKLIYFLDK